MNEICIFSIWLNDLHPIEFWLDLLTHPYNVYRHRFQLEAFSWNFNLTLFNRVWNKNKIQNKVKKFEFWIKANE